MLKPRSHLRRRLLTYLLLAGIVALLAGGGFAAFESHQVSSYGQGVWWALSLMSTVGFVGHPPESIVGRLVSSVLMVSGFALMALVTAAIASLFVSEEQEPEEQTEALFEAQALLMLENLQQRLEVIEAALTATPTRAPGVHRPANGIVTTAPRAQTDAGTSHAAPTAAAAAELLDGDSPTAGTVTS